MKKLIFLIALLLFLIACHSTPRKPDLVANGKEFRFRESCVMSHDEMLRICQENTDESKIFIEPAIQHTTSDFIINLITQNEKIS